MNQTKVIGVSLIVGGLGLLLWAGINLWPTAPPPLWQQEPLVPTARPQSDSVDRNVAQSAPTPINRVAIPVDARRRFGVGVPFPPFPDDLGNELTVGWYLAWRVLESPVRPNGSEFWQMIRLNEQGFRPDEAAIRRVAQANPGTTWLIGNEPDVIWQDNVTPARYAEQYYQLYELLKTADPTCQVAIGGVTQPTPLRLRYLDEILSAYEQRYGAPMPVDVWNVHNFILPEKRGSWGVDIPPGLDVDEGLLYEIEDHDDLEIFKQQLIDFRRWLAERGQQGKPLIVSEYGILMPEDYGFGPERVEHFLIGTYEMMLTAADETIGYPADDYRLVQAWAWYSLSDNRYPTGNFIDFESGILTPLGRVHQQFMVNLPKN